MRYEGRPTAVACAAAAELALRFLRSGTKESRSVTPGDLSINREEEA